jgi:stage II sporulation protein D
MKPLCVGLLLVAIGAPIRCDGSPPPVVSLPGKIRIWILSRYHTERVEIRVTGGLLYADGESRPIRNETVTFYIRGGELHYSGGGGEMGISHAILEGSNLSVIFSHGSGVERRRYSGAIEITEREGGLHLIHELSSNLHALQTARAESAELFTASGLKGSPAAVQNFLRAMEIAVRSYGASNRGRHGAEGADLCDLTHCMHFRGIIGGPSGEAERSAYDPELLVTREGGILPAFFHSTCGGRLAGPESYWPDHRREANFRRGEDRQDSGEPLCGRSPHLSWSRYVSGEEIRKITGLSPVRSLAPLYTDNRVSHLLIDRGDGRVERITAHSFLSSAGRVLGWGALKSNDFTIQPDDAGYKFTGRGLGHGIGLCQWGAAEMASRGAGYREILSFYYPGARIAGVRYE